MTKFEEAQKQIPNENLPHVSYQSKQLNYWAYQVAVHHYNLKLMAKGMKFRNIKLTEIKDYYGLNGKKASEVLKDFEARILPQFKKEKEQLYVVYMDEMILCDTAVTKDQAITIIKDARREHPDAFFTTKEVE